MGSGADTSAWPLCGQWASVTAMDDQRRLLFLNCTEPLPGTGVYIQTPVGGVASSFVVGDLRIVTIGMQQNYPKVRDCYELYTLGYKVWNGFSLSACSRFLFYVHGLYQGLLYTMYICIVLLKLG